MPRVSVFTPSHHPVFLDQCYASMANQIYGDWEWIVVLNGKARWQPPVDDARVRVLQAPPEVVGVGALKRLACSFALGEFLVEFDHDDLLVGEALALVVEAFDAHPEVGLVHSQFAQIAGDGSRCEDRFNPEMGWEYRDVTIDDQLFLQCDALESFPSAVGYIWFAPNHIRAFRKTAYDAVGGYDASFDVLDDQDLMCRLYMHSDFHLIDHCLYLQRVHPKNTQTQPAINQRIQVETVALYDRYIESLALAWTRRQGLLALDLGAAFRKPEGYLGVDKRQADGVDLVADVTHGIDLADGSVGVIRAVDFLEHIPDKVALFNECYRLLAHGGMLLTLTPSTDGRGAFQDPTHVSYYNENSFWYFTNRQYASFVPEIDCRFQVSRLVTFFPDDWHEEHQIAYVNANLVAVKDGPRIAGELLI